MHIMAHHEELPHEELPQTVEERSCTETVELDELFTYIGKKRGKPT